MPMHFFTSGSPGAVWSRPSDWLAMPADAANKVSILTAVFNTASNYVAVKASVSSGTYDVNWGDGTTSTGVASGTQANHTYTYASISSGTLSSLGYRQAIIVITPTTGGANFTALDLGVKNTRTGLVTGTQPYLDILVNAPLCTSFVTYSTNNCGLAQKIVLSAMGSITGAANMFFSCTSLSSLVLPSGFGGAITTATNMFLNCYSLSSLVLPSGFGGAITTATSMFQGCVSLSSLVLPSGFGSAITTTTSMFTGCSALEYVVFACPVTISVASCRMAGAELNALFTALPVAVAQTITVTGNHGAPDCTPSIATLKGWTVTT